MIANQKITESFLINEVKSHLTDSIINEFETMSISENGLTDQQKSYFYAEVPAYCVTVPHINVQSVLTVLSRHDFVLSVKGMRIPSIVECPSANYINCINDTSNTKRSKCILVNTDLKSSIEENVKTQIEKEVNELCNSKNIATFKFNESITACIPYKLRIGFEKLTRRIILDSVLSYGQKEEPQSTSDEIVYKADDEEFHVPGSFEQINHIAHFNLRQERQLKLKYFIGAVVLSTNNNIKTVINKPEAINNEFRVCPLELLAGRPDYIAEQKESGCIFRLDFSKVYWNSRLSLEHAKVAERASKYIDGVIAEAMSDPSKENYEESEIGDIATFLDNEKMHSIIDTTGGIGPFAIPCAKRYKKKVLCNDLNPESYHWMCINVDLNKVSENVHCFNSDGMELLRTIFGVESLRFDKSDIAKEKQKKIINEFLAFKNNRQYASQAAKGDINALSVPRPTVVILNLPEISIQFLKPVSLFRYHTSCVTTKFFIECFSCGIEDKEQKVDGIHALSFYQDVLLRCICVLLPQEVKLIEDKFGINVEETGYSTQIIKEELFTSIIKQSPNSLDAYVSSRLGTDASVERVRLVSNQKWMCRAEFRLPQMLRNGSISNKSKIIDKKQTERTHI